MDETKIYLYQEASKRKYGERKEQLMIQSNESCVKHGGGLFVKWACMAANDTLSLVSTADATADMLRFCENLLNQR